MIEVKAIVLAVLLLMSARQPEHPAAREPTPAELSSRIRQGVRLNDQVQQDFTYLERRRDVKISKLGKVTVGPLRTFEVLPSTGLGEAHKRLVAIDGVPLSAAELAARDAQHHRDLAEAGARDRREPGGRRGEAQARLGEEQRKRELILDDAFRVFEARVVGREVIDGQQVLLADVTPRPGARVVTREGRWMTQFKGQLWIAEADYQIVKVDMHAVGDITIGWGVVGRIHRGSRVRFARRRFENAWLPSEVTYEASGRTLVFRPFQFSVTTTYSDYKRRDKSVTD